MAAAPETYIGSVISLTSKSEIRYEGVLYTINTEESSIGLRNVRSFGSEGRKKDGQQIPASDKIYEYILFRGSDIKDLQVKSSPPAQPASLHNDPAIIQSHYPRPSSSSASLPPAASSTIAEPTSQNVQSMVQMPPPSQGNLHPTPQSVQSGIQMPPPFQGNLPPTSQNVQPGIQMPPPFQGNLPPTSQNVQTGIRMPPPYQGNSPPTSQNVQSGIQMSPPFQGNLPPTSQNVQSGIQMTPPFQGNPFQPPPSLPTWNSSPMPSSVNGSGLAMPQMYWPGYYTAPTGFAHLQQPPFLRPPHGLTVPQALQQSVQYPGLNTSLPAGFPSMPDFPSLLQPSNNQSQTLGASASTLLSVPASSSGSASASATETQVSQLPNKLSAVSASAFSVGLTPPPVNPSTSTIETSTPLSQGMPSVVKNKPPVLPDSSVASLSGDKPDNISASMSTCQPSQPPTANIASSAITVAESIALVTPGQLLPTNSSTSSQTMQTTAVVPSYKSPSVVSSSQAASTAPSAPSYKSPSVVSSSQTASTAPSAHANSSAGSRSQVASSTVLTSRQLEPNNEKKDAKQAELKAKHVGSPSENKEPLLPAPKPILQKPAEASSHVQYNNRGRGRGRGRGRANLQPRPIAKFAEDFDFMAMNEKFNKDEVWDHLGKSNGQFTDDPNEYDDNIVEDDVVSPGKPEVKHVYVKDDFFDSLSSNTIDNGARNGRIKFSEQRKIDTETFGDSARHRPMGMRGGGRGARGGGPRGRGGYYGRGYGYTGRGRGYSYPNHQ
ncbi:hypothetical protein ZWY2020_048908 [Hordeum vulgare]|nr:hypothetical protein ZWY2020_048908 [Hordeum vulgare]